MIGEVLLLAGAVFTLAAAVGVARFRDLFTRAHAFTAGATLGLVLGLVGAAVTQTRPGNRTTLLLAVILQVLTSPLSSNLLNRATYLATGTRARIEAESATVVETDVGEDGTAEGAPPLP